MSSGIDLLIADVDGTLVTPDKTLTEGAQAAARRLAVARVGLTLLSSRPPKGMAALVATLDVRLPYGAFNGGALVARDGDLIEAHRLSMATARRTLDLLAAQRVTAWVFARGDWRLRDPNGPKTDLERRTVGFEPVVVKDFEDVIGDIDKIVGVSDDHALLETLETRARSALGDQATIERSQPYYLDITHAKANKGAAFDALVKRIGVAAERTAVIGDGFNDVAMFAKAGVSIAMGQAAPEVRAKANWVTLSNTEDGFADAVDRFILPRRAAPSPGGE